MKKTIIYFMLLILTACNSDLEKVHYNASESKAAVLQSIDESYVLDAQESDLTAIEFAWSNPVLNYPAAVTTDLQMDLSGHHFGGAVTLASEALYCTFSKSLLQAVRIKSMKYIIVFFIVLFFNY